MFIKLSMGWILIIGGGIIFIIQVELWCRRLNREAERLEKELEILEALIKAGEGE